VVVVGVVGMDLLRVGGEGGEGGVDA